MAIETTQEYQAKEERLEEIKDLLAKIAQEEDINLSKVVELRDEARVLAKELKVYLKSTFETKS